jgi:glycosyltransferase 2 family protein
LIADKGSPSRFATVRKVLSFVGLALGLLLFLQQFRISLEVVRQHSGSIVGHPAWIIASLLLGLLVFPMVMLAWMLIMRRVAVRLTLGKTFEGFQLASLPRYIPGSVWGYLSRSQWLQVTQDVRYSISLQASVLEAAEQGLTALAVGVACFGLSQDKSSRWALVVAATGLVAAVWLIAPPFVAKVWDRFMKSSPMPDGSQKAWAGAIGLQSLLWVIYGVSVLCLCRALSPTSDVTWLEATAASSLAWFVGFVIVFVPSGLGIREGVLAAMLARFGGLSPADASLVAVVSRLGLFLAEFAWLGVGALLYARRWRKESVLR